MPWYFYIALKQLFPTGRPASFFFLLSVVGVMLGVMILVIVQSVMGGFGRVYREKIVTTNGDVRIETGGVIRDHADLLAYLGTRPEVKAATPYAHGFVMLEHRNRPAFPAIRGVDLERENAVIPISDFVTLGGFDALDDESALLSSNLAKSVRASVGSTVEVFTPLMLGRLSQDEVILPRELKVVGIYETGWSDFDTNTMVCTLRLMQELYGLGGGVHGIALRLYPHIDAVAFSRVLNEAIPKPKQAMSWMDMYQDFLWVLRLEKNIMFFLLIFIVLVAAFVIANAQLLTVLRKTREIGLIGAIGGRPGQLVLCYCFQGFFIGFLGTAFGVAGALVSLHYRNDIIHAFAALTESQDTLVKFYQFADIPVHYVASDFVIISVCALILSTLAGFLPAWRAATMRPAEALRVE